MTGAGSPRSGSGRTPVGQWRLEDAQAHFGEVVRRVRTEGPQLVTAGGRGDVVVVAAEEFRRLAGGATGAALVAALQASPYKDIEIEPERSRLTIRGAEP
ncbi:prevent-host-death protein [Rhodoplanes elegans]|uniref:Antitoxin n=1 Tax=Rhodoplanes elegans TaxID=29408 RepID=A0A327KF86_9BRAD|nr:type II toxin-antitoxin system Phd/YefM family antitoxin [Rhodoplanes elegans]MBK5961925.1 prevent-host-death protein [Rhodoplanes elegans]RAI33898.1 prevent-host-death protein [Rhodoplanes elegans]